MNILLSTLSSLIFAVVLVLVARLGRSKDKTLPILIALLFFSSLSYGQTAFPYNNFRCGTWAAQPEYFSPWETTDTLGDKKTAALSDSVRLWIYDQEQPVVNFVTDDVYRPCGAGPTERYFQWRMCKLTGIRQKRYRVVPFKYIEHERTEYERLEDSLSDMRDRGTGEGGIGKILDSLMIGDAGFLERIDSSFIISPQTKWIPITNSEGQIYYAGRNKGGVIPYSIGYVEMDTVEVCRNISNPRRAYGAPYPSILYLIRERGCEDCISGYLDSKKHPLKPWIRVWEN